MVLLWQPNVLLLLLWQQHAANRHYDHSVVITVSILTSGNHRGFPAMTSRPYYEYYVLVRFLTATFFSLALFESNQDP